MLLASECTLPQNLRNQESKHKYAHEIGNCIQIVKNQVFFGTWMHNVSQVNKNNIIFMLECEKDQKNTLKYASFSRIFIFRVKQFSCRKNIYQRYCQSMVSNNCLNYSSLVWNTKSCNIIASLDFISLRVYPTPKFTNSRYETQKCIWISRLY